MEDTKIQDLKPHEFMQIVQSNDPDWPEKFGGPAGVAAMAAIMQERIVDLSIQIAEVRAAAIQKQLETNSGVEVARTLGVTKAAISRVSKAKAWRGIPWKA